MCKHQHRLPGQVMLSLPTLSCHGMLGIKEDMLAGLGTQGLRGGIMEVVLFILAERMLRVN